MKYQIIINTLPFQLTNFKSFFKRYGLENRNNGFYWPNRYLVGEVNKSNHNWILYSSNLRSGVAEEFLIKTILMNECGLATVLFFDFNELNMTQEVFEDKLIKVLSLLTQSGQEFCINLISLNDTFSYPSFLYFDTKLDYKNDSSLLQSYKANFIDLMNEKSIKDLCLNITTKPYQTKLEEAIKKDIVFIDILNDKELTSILTKLLKTIEVIEAKSNTQKTIQKLQDQQFFDKYRKFKAAFKDEYSSDSEIDSTFINFWLLVNNILV